MKREFIENKKVLMRVDYNVPIENSVIQDIYRISKTIPMIKFCLDNNASIVIMSHLGRPKGVYNEKYSLSIIKGKLEELLGTKVKFSDDCISDKAIKRSQKLNPGEVHLLENLRFYNQELENDKSFSLQLSRHGDIYINEAFGTAHRSHASNVGVCNYMQHKYCGFLMSDEYKYLCGALKKPKLPYTVVLGGAKVTGKIELINAIIHKADYILIGGAMAFTFLKAKGIYVGDSFYEEENVEIAKNIIDKCNNLKVEIILPIDLIVSSSIENGSESFTCNVSDIKSGMKGFDIGTNTCNQFKKIINKSKTIVWNGPLGVAENEYYSKGTMEIGKEISEVTKGSVKSIIGGGDTASTLKKLCSNNNFTHISTGGGASLELLTGKELPAFKAIYGK